MLEREEEKTLWKESCFLLSFCRSKPFTEKLAIVKDYIEKDVSAMDVEENLGMLELFALSRFLKTSQELH
jgi:hypothetical protein